MCKRTIPGDDEHCFFCRIETTELWSTSVQDMDGETEPVLACRNCMGIDPEET